MALVIVALSLSFSGVAQAGSGGSVTRGTLTDGFQLPLSHAHHRFFGPVRSRGTNYLTVEVAGMLVWAAKTVTERAPEGGDALMVVGDGSASEGGRIPRHVSHTSGRDVDVIFYARNERGDRVTPSRFCAYNKRGISQGAGCELVFDVASNWWLVRTLLVSTVPAVQWIFVSRHVKKRLLRYARDRSEHPEILARATKVLHQPAGSAPHDDHFHIRTYCTERDLSEGCVDTGVRWDWVDDTGRSRPIPR